MFFVNRIVGFFRLAVASGFIFGGTELIRAFQLTTGSTVTLSVTADGTSPFSYQWLKNSVKISGATASSYVISKAQPADAGDYSAIVSNSAGSITAPTQTLTVVSPAGSVETGELSSGAADTNNCVDGPGIIRAVVISNSTLSVAVSSGSNNSRGGGGGNDPADAGTILFLFFAASGTVDFLKRHRSTDSATLRCFLSEEGTERIGERNGRIWTLMRSPAATLDRWRASATTWPGLLNQRFITLIEINVNNSVCFTSAIRSCMACALQRVGAVSFISGMFAMNFFHHRFFHVIAGILLASGLGLVRADQVPAGSTVVLSVSADGTSPFTYQWKKDGQVLPGSVGPTLKITNVTLASTGAYSVVVTNAAGFVESPVSVLTIPSLTILPSASKIDMNGDGAPDILWQNANSGESFIWFMKNGTHVGGISLGSVDAKWSTAATADFNGDGEVDILWQNSDTGERFIWLMKGGYHVGGASLGFIDTDWTVSAASDFNGDGKPDILWQNTVSGERFIWFMNGVAHGGGTSLGIVSQDWSIADAIDFNSDGNADILWQNTLTGERFIWLMDGTNHVGGISIGVVDTDWSIVAANDYNGDGQPDLFWQNEITGQRFLWLMNGSDHQSDLDFGFVDTAWNIMK